MFKECYIEIEQAIEENIKKLGVNAEFFVLYLSVKSPSLVRAFCSDTNTRA